ncbi:MAG: ROK family protein [Chitinophagaceae bacterium]|nr:ROK family protein [Chitinophagaceae bacterium]
MSLLGIDLGGTKLATAVFSEGAELLGKESLPLEKRHGAAVGALLTAQVSKLVQQQQQLGDPVAAIGVCIPGISNRKEGTVCAPNIPGWENYPLAAEIKAVAPGIPVAIDSDRTCYIMGEAWKGAAQGCTDAIFIGVGTGIGAGILADGHFLRGHNDTAGAVGWMAMQKPWHPKYRQCGHFETMASGDGIAKVARELLEADPSYNGVLGKDNNGYPDAAAVFAAFQQEDPLAKQVISQCVEWWGMAVANLVSIFNPEKIIMGGGVFGPAIPLIPAIYEEAAKWAQPLSIQRVEVVPSQLGPVAGCWGAGLLALQAKAAR